jgi:phage/plasmid-associated DNA primase
MSINEHVDTAKRGRPSFGRSRAVRGLDLFDTPPRALDPLFEHEPLLAGVRVICEPFAGRGNLVTAMRSRGITVHAADICAADAFMMLGLNKHTTDIADLQGYRCVVTTEVEQGQFLRWGLIKQITGGEPVKARKMRQDNQEFQPTCKLNMYGNNKPETKDASEGEKRRLCMVPCNMVVEKEDDIKDFAEKLVKEEGSAILRWMIDGCIEWQRDGLTIPQCVKEETDEYFDTQDAFALWAEEWCTFGTYRAQTGPNNTWEERERYTRPSDLWTSWVTFVETKKLRGKGLNSQTSFLDKLKKLEGIRKEDNLRLDTNGRILDKGHPKIDKEKRIRAWVGITATIPQSRDRF